MLPRRKWLGPGLPGPFRTGGNRNRAAARFDGPARSRPTAAVVPRPTGPVLPPGVTGRFGPVGPPAGFATGPVRFERRRPARGGSAGLASIVPASPDTTVPGQARNRPRRPPNDGGSTLNLPGRRGTASTPSPGATARRSGRRTVGVGPCPRRGRGTPNGCPGAAAPLTRGRVGLAAPPREPRATRAEREVRPGEARTSAVRDSSRGERSWGPSLRSPAGDGRMRPETPGGCP